MKIDKQRIKNANESVLLSIKIFLVMGLFVGLFIGFIYLITKVSYWFLLIIIPLIWASGYFANPERHTI